MNGKEQATKMNIDIVRAWKDRNYRNSLSGDELALLPDHPIGSIELNEEELAGVAGGMPCISGTVSCCEETVSDIDMCCPQWTPLCPF